MWPGVNSSPGTSRRPRANLERLGGREVTTSGDGLLATFNGPAQALRCAAAIRRAASQEDLQVRVGIHVGEVELVGSDVRGVAVHEPARIMARRTRARSGIGDYTDRLAGLGPFFEDRGIHRLKGLPGEWRLFAYVEDPQTRPR
jgi:class 3 adenylate cyclase